jgi:signal transduction histidine kinase
LISSLIQDCKSQIQAEHSNLQIMYKSTTDDPLIVKADKGRIIQCISNLLSNAIKFSAKEGSDGNGDIVSITIGKEEEQEREQMNNYTSNNQEMRKERIDGEDKGKAIVSISDNGEGIDPQIVPRLFNKFATKSEKGGTGLGLFISKSIIEAHGGKIWAENNKDGKGATFSFTLPLSKDIVVDPFRKDSNGYKQ